MNDLVLSEFVISENGEAFTDSLRVAKHFDKDHAHILRSIRELECSEKFIQSNFGLIEYVDLKGRKQPSYKITRDGFIFLAMGFTGEKASKTKELYISAFNQMSTQLKSIQSISMAMIEKETGAALRLANMFGLEGNQAKLSAMMAINKYYGVNVQELIGVTHLVSDVQETLLTPTEIGKQLGMSSQKCNLALRDLGFQKKIGDAWIVTDEGKKYSILLDTTKKHSTGTPIQQIKWKSSVIELLKMRVAA